MKIHKEIKVYQRFDDFPPFLKWRESKCGDVDIPRGRLKLTTYDKNVTCKKCLKKLKKERK